MLPGLVGSLGPVRHGDADELGETKARLVLRPGDPADPRTDRLLGDAELRGDGRLRVGRTRTEDRAEGDRRFAESHGRVVQRALCKRKHRDGVVPQQATFLRVAKPKKPQLDAELTEAMRGELAMHMRELALEGKPFATSARAGAVYGVTQQGISATFKKSVGAQMALRICDLRNLSPRTIRERYRAGQYDRVLAEIGVHLAQEDRKKKSGHASDVDASVLERPTLPPEANDETRPGGEPAARRPPRTQP